MQPPSSLPSSIEVLPGTDVADAWERFEIFEALHHTLQICNPLTSSQLDEMVRALQLNAGNVVLDVACGYGEVLFRAAAQAPIVGTGIDLSPWMITGAYDRAQTRAPAANLSWVLGEARDFRLASPPDVVICIGAEWVWHDFKGTARALAEQVRPGGVVVIGSETGPAARNKLENNGLEPFHCIEVDESGWQAYLDQTAESAQQWARQHPGERADQWINEQAGWQQARTRSAEVDTWSLWMSRKA